MSRILNEACKVIVKDGDMMLTMPDGGMIPLQLDLTLHDPAKSDDEKFTTATVNFIVDIRGLEKG